MKVAYQSTHFDSFPIKGFEPSFPMSEPSDKNSIEKLLLRQIQDRNDLGRFLTNNAATSTSNTATPNQFPSHGMVDAFPRGSFQGASSFPMAMQAAQFAQRDAHPHNISGKFRLF